jgi:hypothetical protein
VAPVVEVAQHITAVQAVTTANPTAFSAELLNWLSQYPGVGEAQQQPPPSHQ